MGNLFFMVFSSQVLGEKDVDPVRTTSNDICEVFSVSKHFLVSNELSKLVIAYPFQG